MKTFLLKSIIFMTLLAGVFSACITSDDYDTPNLACVDPNLTTTKTVQDIIAMATSAPTPEPTLYTADDIIEAYVTSSDEKGNIYKSISFQTIPTDGSNPVGFSTPINVGSTFAEGFIPGKKVYIKLKGLYIAMVYGSLQIGELYLSSPTATPIIGRISELSYKNFLFPSCSEVAEDSFVRTMTLATAINNNNLNTLIELDNVQFAETSLGRTYYDVDSGGGATNHMVTSGSSSVILRISSFAPFSGKMVPSGSGKIRGVLTKYASDFQFMIRYESDIKLNGVRLDESPPIVGNAITYPGSMTENFESYSTTSPANKTFPKYINDAVVGSRYWANTTFGGNKYIQMTSFGNPAENNRSLFIVPVDMTAASTFSFQSKSGYTNGNVLKVYYILAANYTPGAAINNANLVDITSYFTMSPGLSTGYPTNFTGSGNYNIPAGVTGNGFFVLEYIGSGVTGLTSTMQIDNLAIN